MQGQPLCGALFTKTREQLELLDGLIAKLPEDHTSRLLGHLLDCLAGMCAVLYAAKPDLLCHFDTLRNLSVNHACCPAEARHRIAEYGVHIAEGFAVLLDADLARSVPTVFVPSGETLLTLILGNLEHIVNHKHELFTELKAMGADVGTPDLYRFRD